MRDIRQDLKIRLAANEKRRAEVAAELKRLDDEAQAITSLFAFEEVRHSPEAAKTAKEPEVPIADAVMTLLRSEGPMTRDEAIPHLEQLGYLGNEPTPRRKVHVTMLNLKMKGFLDFNKETKRYSLPKNQGARGVSASERPN